MAGIVARKDPVRNVQGDHSSYVEVTNTSSHGFWLLADGKEFPWFKDAPVGHIIDVKQPSPGFFDGSRND